jgi:hypothetical protein
MRLQGPQLSLYFNYVLHFFCDNFIDDFFMVLSTWIVALASKWKHNRVHLCHCFVKEILKLSGILSNFGCGVSPQILKLFFLFTLLFGCNRSSRFLHDLFDKNFLIFGCHKLLFALKSVLLQLLTLLFKSLSCFFGDREE